MATGRTSSAGWMPLFVVFLTMLASVASAQQATFRQPSTPAKPAPKGEVADSGSSRTRFIVGLERSTDFKVSALANPNRVLIDLPQMRLDLPNPPGETPVGGIKSFHHGLTAPGRMRVIIDVTGPVVIEKSALEKSPDGRSDLLVLDIVAAAEVTAAPDTRPAPAAGLQPPLPKPAQRRKSGS